MNGKKLLALCSLASPEGLAAVHCGGVSAQVPDIRPSLGAAAMRFVCNGCDYEAMSFSFFSGRTLTTLRAGLALKVVGSPVKGLVP